MNHTYRYESLLLDNFHAVNMIQYACQHKRSFSLSRFGIGEISYLSWPSHLFLLENFSKYQNYAGATCTPEVVKEDLYTALKTVDMAGLIPPWRLDDWAKLTYQVLKQAKIIPKHICDAWLMHDMVQQGTIWTLLCKRKVILVGRRSMEAAKKFEEHGVPITGCFPLNGYEDMDMVFHSIMNKADWEIVLISAGIPASILAPRIAKASGRVAIDFGHALDIIVDGENYNHSMLVEKWNANKSTKD